MSQARRIQLPGTAFEEYDEDAARSVGFAHLFLAELKDIDARLDLVWAKPGAQSLDGGYWYIVRRNEGAPDSYWKIQTPQGEYSDPGPEHIEMLKRIDSHAHPGAYIEYRKRCDEQRRQGRKARDELHREFREKLEERLAHVFDKQSKIAVTAAMKASAEGHSVTDEGVILPGGVRLEDLRRAAASDSMAGLSQTVAEAKRGPDAEHDEHLGALADWRVRKARRQYETGQIGAAELEREVGAAMGVEEGGETSPTPSED